MLQKLRPAGSPTDHLFVGTDRFNYFVVSWDEKARQLKTENSYLDLADKTARDSQSSDRCLIDPTGRYMTLEIYEGVVTILPILQSRRKVSGAFQEAGTLGEVSPVRIEELFIRSSAFLYSKSSSEKTRLAILYEDNNKKVRIRLRDLIPADGSFELKEATEGDSSRKGKIKEDPKIVPSPEVEDGSSHLIPVEAPWGGFFVLGETSISYYDNLDESPLEQELEEPTVFVTWTAIDAQRWLLADDYGKLYLMMLIVEGDRVSEWKLDILGDIPRASTLTYMDGGIVFVGSHQGDSQLVRISAGELEVVQTFSNIAPIIDFTVMDLGNRTVEGQVHEFSSGQARIVTGSGAFQDGSLRSVRSGVGLEDVGILTEMQHVTDLFSLRIGEYSAILLASFVDETRAFQFSPEGEVEEVPDFKGFSLSQSTLLAANLPHARLLHVTESSVTIVDEENGMAQSEWTPPAAATITAASANDEHLIVSIGGQALIVLSLGETIQEISRRDFGVESQVACVTVSESPSVCVVGFWQSASIAILSVKDLSTVRTEQLGKPGVAVPRSIALTQLLEDSFPTLLVAMADGNVITFSYNPQDSTLSERKSILLGTQQATFTILPRGDGLSNVFAICEHPSLIYGSEGRIVYSAVTAEKASCVCPFSSEAYPDSIAIATSDDLRIAMVDTERTTHVQTLPLHETVRRVAYSSELKAFGLGTIRRTLEAGEEIVKSYFKLADEVLFKDLDSYTLNDDELVESVMRAEFNINGESEERFVVGTSYLDDQRDESVRGRIIVFEVTPERQLAVTAELAVKGACRALAMVDGNLIAGLVKTVCLFLKRMLFQYMLTLFLS